MIETIFSQLPEHYVIGTVRKPVSYYFSLGEARKTVLLEPERCVVAEGKAVEKADCVCKTSPEFFEKIWVEGYLPGLKDFLAGSIKSNDPAMLKQFLRCFGKEA